MLIGTAIYEKDFRKLHEFDDGFDKLTEDAVQRLMARQAMEKKSQSEKEAQMEVNGQKTEYGNGVSTLLMIYNAMGIPLAFKSAKDGSGHIWKYDYDDRIENGQWSCVLHVKTSGTATGSCATLGYKLLGYGHDDIASIGFVSSYSGSNSGHCSVMSLDTWNKTSWQTLFDRADDGPEKGTNSFGRARVHYSTSQMSSPIFECVLTRSDIGYYD